MSNNRLVFITIDALRYDVACSHLGFMHHLIEQGLASRYQVKSELPAMSRPLYEVLLTGTPVWKNQVTHNDVVRLSHELSLFHLTKEQGLTNAAAAYYWVSELYNSAPFQVKTDRIQLNTDLPIQNGIFYFEDHYPDSHLFADAAYLLQKEPDFLYVHSMNVDDDGHKFTGESKEYRNRVVAVDVVLAQFIPLCLELGYQVIVTADHGMTADGMHGGNTNADRDVPLFVISEKVKPGVYEQIVPQLQLAPLACHLLSIQPSEQMVPLMVKGIVK